MPSDRLPTLENGRRIYAVGDIHGRLDLLLDMRARIEADLEAAPPADASVVFVGDYVDRGPDSRGVIEFLCHEPIGDTRRICLKGNHEAMLLDFLDDPIAGLNWCANGAVETLASYGVDVEIAGPSALEQVQAEFRASLPETHARFLTSLALYHGAGDYLFVHAGVRPRVALSRQREHDLLWIREPFYADPGAIDRYVVHGHTPVEYPVILPHRADIDTGAWFTGRLTCLVLEGTSMRLLGD